MKGGGEIRGESERERGGNRGSRRGANSFHIVLATILLPLAATILPDETRPRDTLSSLFTLANVVFSPSLAKLIDIADLLARRDRSLIFFTFETAGDVIVRDVDEGRIQIRSGSQRRRNYRRASRTFLVDTRVVDSFPFLSIAILFLMERLLKN